MRRLVQGTCVAFVVANGLSALRAQAVPRHSARFEQRCGLCHVNPTGGGLRTTYASRQLVPREIAWHQDEPEVMAGFGPQIATNVLVGTDFRELFVGSPALTDRLNFFQMQGDLYFDFQMNPKLSLYYDRGTSNAYELFGLDYLSPALYVKAGRFVPSYGWKFDDHTMYVRSERGFMPPANSDVGIEVGFSRGPLDAQMDVVNGSRGSIQDTDPLRLATAANAMVRFHVGSVGASAGLAGYRDVGQRRRIDSGGLYGYLTWKGLVWLGETDLFRERPAGGAATTGLVTSHELTCLVHQGAEVILTYDFYDPDRDRATGAKSRWGGGLQVMPYPYVSLGGLLRRTTFDNGIAYSGRAFTETVLQLHLLY